MVNISMCDHNQDAVRLVVGIEALVHGLSDVDGVVKQNCVFALYYLSFDDVNMRMLRRADMDVEAILMPIVGALMNTLLRQLYQYEQKIHWDSLN